MSRITANHGPSTFFIEKNHGPMFHPGMKAKKSHERAEGQAQISLSLPAELLDKINRLAKADGRSRSNWIVRMLNRKVEAETAPQIPTPTFPSTASRTPTGALSLNEEPPKRDAVAPTRATPPAPRPVTKTRRALRGMITKENPKP